MIRPGLKIHFFDGRWRISTWPGKKKEVIWKLDDNDRVVGGGIQPTEEKAIERAKQIILPGDSDPR